MGFSSSVNFFLFFLSFFLSFFLGDIFSELRNCRRVHNVSVSKLCKGSINIKLAQL